MTDEDRQALIDRLSPDAMLLEPREVFDVALVDVTDTPKDHWPRKRDPVEPVVVAVYDEALCVEAIVKWLECDDDEALDYFGYNTSGAWVGEGTPTFRRDIEDDSLAGEDD